MTAVASMAQTFTKAQEFLTILRNESSMFSKKGKRRKLWDEIMQYDFKNESKITNNEKMMVVYRFIQNHFNKSIYENLTKPNPNTGKLLMDKVYWMIWTPARRAAVKEANKHAHEAAKAAKQAELKKQKKEAAKKRADKEKMEIFRLGKGDEALGTKRYQERMRKDGNAKAEKEAAEVSQDAKKLLEFWTWRLGEGKYYDKKMRAADIERPGQYAYAHKSKTISLKSECIMKTLTYLLEKKVATKPCITFKDDSQGTVHYSTLVHLPTNDSRHITTMPVRPLNFVKHRQTPAEISGPITGFRMCEGKLYFRVNNMSMPNTHMLLPKKWEKFNKAAAKWIGSKKYEACPNHRVNVPLLLNLRDPKGIKSISWVESETKYTAVVQTYGKDLAYIKSLRGKSQAEKEADALKEMQAAAAQQKEQRRIESIARQFAKQPGYSASATTILEAFKQVEQQTATKPKFCSSCGAKINNLTLSGSKAKFCGECGTRFV
jgi:hypothetical protein